MSMRARMRRFIPVCLNGRTLPTAVEGHPSGHGRSAEANSTGWTCTCRSSHLNGFNSFLDKRDRGHILNDALEPLVQRQAAGPALYIRVRLVDLRVRLCVCTRSSGDSQTNGRFAPARCLYSSLSPKNLMVSGETRRRGAPTKMPIIAAQKNALARCPAAKAKLHTLSRSVPEEKYLITLDRRDTSVMRTHPRIEASCNTTISSINCFATIGKCNFSFHIWHYVQKDALKH